MSAGGAVAAARIFSLLCAAVQLPLLTRLLSPEDYAFTAIAIAVATYFSVFSAEPVILPFQRYPGSDSDRSNYAYALRRTLVWSAVAVALTVILGVVIGAPRWGFAVAGWGLGIGLTRLVSTGWLMWNSSWKYAGNLIVSTGIRTFALVGLVLLGWDALLAVALAGALSGFAALAFGPKKILQRFPTSTPWTSGFGIKLALGSLGFTVLTSFPLIVLPVFAANTAVSQFAAMTQVVALSVGALIGLVLTVEYPRLRRDWDAGEVRGVARRTTLLQFGCILLGTAAVAIGAFADGVIIKTFLPAPFVEASLLFPLVAASVLGYMGQLSGWQHQFSHNASWVAKGTTASSVIGGGIILILGLFFDMDGVAFGSTVAFFIYFLVMSHGVGATNMAKVAAFALLLAASVEVWFEPAPWTQLVLLMTLTIGALVMAAITIFGRKSA